MLVAELIEALTRFPGDTEVIICVEAFEWRSLAQLDPPCSDEDDVQRAVCLVAGWEAR